MTGMALESRHLSTVIRRPPAEVYDYTVEPRNLPQWASGLAQTRVEQRDGRWVADSTMGPVTFSFVERNELGVLDHVVTLPSGESVDNPLRVISYGEASEVVFTLRRRPGMSDAQFAQDADAVTADLARLKQILEA